MTTILYISSLQDIERMNCLKMHTKMCAVSTIKKKGEICKTIGTAFMNIAYKVLDITI